ncbi:MAG: hypothetical protein ABI120_11650 [Gemmatimonadaceae bacterium]
MSDSESCTALSLIDRIKRFNAKERYWVLREVLGEFPFIHNFAVRAAKAAGVEPPEITNSSLYFAMDYHLNWLYAALSGYGPGDGYPNHRFSGPDELADVVEGDGGSKAGILEEDRALIENSQEDVDLLLAWRRADGVTQLILAEAKCTDRFTKEQLKSKANRLCGILRPRPSDPCPNDQKIDVKLILLSPVRLQQQNTIENRLNELRDYCRKNNCANLIPATGTLGSPDTGWMPMQSVPEEAFWVVKFGPRVSNEDPQAREERRAAGKEKSRWFWPTWRLEARGSNASKRPKG